MAQDVMNVLQPSADPPPQQSDTVDEAALKALDYKTLNKKHPDYEKWYYRWDDYRLMYKGGEEFMTAAGMPARITRVSTTGGAAGMTASAQLIPGSQTRIPRRFLWQLEGEPNASYLSRLERAFYIGYVGPIIDYFVHYLYSQKAVVRPAPAQGESEAPELPDWFVPFERDCTGGNKALFDFFRDQFKELLITKRCGWLIGSPADTSGMSQSEAESLGVDGVVLESYQADEILDWETDDSGELVFVVVRKFVNKRQFPRDRQRYEVIKYADRNWVATWEAHEVEQSGQTSGERDVTFIGAKKHSAGCVPFVMPEIPDGLWVGNKLGGCQLDLFNQLNVLSRSELLSCFIQPILYSNDDNASSRVFGEGNILKLRVGDKTQEAEKFEWSSANIDPLRFLAERLRDKLQECYRIVHQMSLAIDGDSATAVARSGLSKIEERRATEIILVGFGGYARDMVIRTLNIISKLLGDDNTWMCIGYDNFQVSSLEEELQTAALIQTLNIKSRTLNEELDKKMARRILDHADEGTLANVDDEIKQGYDDQEAAADAKQDALTQMAMQGAGGAVAPASVTPTQPAANGMPPVPPKAKPPQPPLAGNARK